MGIFKIINLVLKTKIKGNIYRSVRAVLFVVALDFVNLTQGKCGKWNLN